MPDWFWALLISLPTASLAEYWLHRSMHTWLLKKVHAMHHKEGTGQGWFLEFKDYLKGGILVGWLGFLYSVEVGLGWLAGMIIYGAWAAYSHQLQHERPELCFWLPRPVHFIHHHQHMWHHNFGISFDFWDRVFGTYKKVDWQPQPDRPRFSLLGMLKIRWF